MLSRKRFNLISATAVTTLFAVAACESPTVFEGSPGVSAAKGGQPKNPVVRSVTPDTAVQATTLDVVVSGDNFEDGSVVDWLIDGNPTTDVSTNSTSFVDKRTLRANITVASDAPTVLYDARVTTPPGRRGIGSEKLEVKQKGNPNDLTAITEMRLLSGHDLTDDGLGAYVDGQDGAFSRVGGQARTSVFRSESTREFCWDFSGYSSLFPGVTEAELPFDQSGFSGCVGGSVFTRDHSLADGLVGMDSSVPALRTLLAEGPFRLDDPDDDGWFYLLAFGLVHDSAPECAQNIPGMVDGEGFLVTMTSGRGDDPTSDRRWTLEPNPAAVTDAVLWRFRDPNIKRRGKPQPAECIAIFNEFSFLAEFVELP